MGTEVQDWTIDHGSKPFEHDCFVWLGIFSVCIVRMGWAPLCFHPHQSFTLCFMDEKMDCIDIMRYKAPCLTSKRECY